MADRVELSLPALPAPDYYTGVTVTVAGAGDVPVASGGRFDDLVAALGGESRPAVGVEFDHPTLSQLADEPREDAGERDRDGEGAHARVQ